MMSEIKGKENERKEYLKKYYEEHKEKMNEKMKELLPERTKRNIIQKLNAGKYTRIPYEKIKKYNINFNEDTKKYN